MAGWKTMNEAKTGQDPVASWRNATGVEETLQRPSRRGDDYKGLAASAGFFACLILSGETASSADAQPPHRLKGGGWAKEGKELPFEHEFPVDGWFLESW